MAHAPLIPAKRRCISGRSPTGRRMISPAKAPLPDLFASMNKTEKQRGIELEAMKRAGQIAEWWFERFTFKLADDTRYTPDFVIQENDGTLRCEEIKGSFTREDARPKYTMMATAFPLALRVLQSLRGDPGNWRVIEVKSL